MMSNGDQIHIQVPSMWYGLNLIFGKLLPSHSMHNCSHLVTSVGSNDSINPQWPLTWMLHSAIAALYFDINILLRPTYFNQFQKPKWLLRTSWQPPGPWVFVEFPKALCADHTLSEFPSPTFLHLEWNWGKKLCDLPVHAWVHVV